MKKIHRGICVFVLSLMGLCHPLARSAQEPVAPATAAATKQDAAAGKQLSDFLADKDAGQISASSMVGVAGSAITNIQTSQDVIIAFKPSDGKSKSGYGISITPARTSFHPMSVTDYYNGGPGTRILGALTLSYATKDAEVVALSITKRAISIDSVLYWFRNQDPIIAGLDALHNCVAADSAWRDMIEAGDRNDRPAFEVYTKSYAAAVQDCLDNSKKMLPWNAARISLALGTGQISGTGFETRSLGSAIILNAMIPLGPKGSLQPLYRRTWNEIDLKSLGSTLVRGESNLFAARVTYGLLDSSRVQLLAEISNLKKTQLAQSETLFKNAIGIDWGVAKGIWLQLRYGNARRSDSSSFEKTGLLSLNLSPSCALSAKCGK